MTLRLLGSPAQWAAILAACAGATGVFLLLLLGDWSLFDLSSLTVLKSVKSNSAGVVLTTHYNPLALAFPAALAFTGVAGIGFVLLRGASSGSSSATSGGQLAPADDVAKAGFKLETELSKVLAFIRSHLGSSEAYAKSLANAQTRLAALTEPKQVRVVVSLLVAENERMRRDTNELKTKLEEAKARIESLHTSLSKAQEIGLQDPLTAVGNRRCFDETLEKEIIEAESSRKPLSLVMCDIDNFKVINDSFGHSVGDEVLKMFAALLADNIRESDTVTRCGGEEFGIILPQTAQESAIGLAERMRRQCESKQLIVRNANQTIGKVTASFGVAQHREGDGPEMLVQRADAKLYEAKCAGRNRVAAYGRTTV
jgi:diguanylate cyclase